MLSALLTDMLKLSPAPNLVVSNCSISEAVTMYLAWSAGTSYLVRMTGAEGVCAAAAGAVVAWGIMVLRQGGREGRAGCKRGDEMFFFDAGLDVHII